LSVDLAEISRVLFIIYYMPFRLSDTENSIELDVIYAGQINFLLPLVAEEIGNWNIRRFFCDLIKILSKY